MLLEFTVGNFLSFKDKKTFSLEAGSISELKENVVHEGKYKVLRSAVLYGANSSGKSNFIKAFEFMVKTIKNSSKLNSTDILKATPFLLNTETESEPSYFEIIILEKRMFGNIRRYRYGFELDNKKIHSEWLYILEENSKTEELCFVRETQNTHITEMFKEGDGLELRTNENALFLSLVDQFNGSIANSLMKMIGHLFFQSGIDHHEGASMTSVMFNSEYANHKISEFIKKLDLGFKEFKIDNEINSGFKNKINTIHKKYDKNGNSTDFEFKLTENESSGTNKIFDLAGYLIFSLHYGLALIIDELDSKLHPILTQEIIKLFNDTEANPNNAQLIFTTHDTNLLGANLFRRDQIWFTEKDEFEATDLYSLLEFKDNDGKTIRKDRSFEADYIKGRYGAIPYISNF